MLHTGHLKHYPWDTYFSMVVDNSYCDGYGMDYRVFLGCLCVVIEHIYILDIPMHPWTMERVLKWGSDGLWHQLFVNFSY